MVKVEQKDVQDAAQDVTRIENGDNHSRITFETRKAVGFGAFEKDRVTGQYKPKVPPTELSRSR